MAKALVIVESPAKAKTINKYLGRDFKVIASMGHVRDLPKSKLGVDVDAKFEPEYVVLPDRVKVIKEMKDLAKTADEIYVATDPDREGEAIGWHLTEELGASEEEGPPVDVQRDHQEGDPRGHQASGRDRHEDGRRAAGATRPRPSRRLQDQSHPLGQGAARVVGRARAVGRAQAHLRPRARDRSVRPRRVLAHHRASRRPGAAGVRRAARAQGRGGRQGQESGGSRRGPRRSQARDVRRLVGHAEGTEEARDPAVHHEQAAAGVALPGQEDDDGRAAALRRHRSAGRGSRDRVDYLHAHGLGACFRPGARRGARLRQDAVWRRLRAGAGEPLQAEVLGAGRARGDPADVDEVRPGVGPGVSHAGPVLSVSP